MNKFIYDEHAIDDLYQNNLKEAAILLSSLKVAENRIPNVTGLRGWIYEQTIHYCLKHELSGISLSPDISEQVALKGRAKIDLLVGTIAIEIKALGSFGNDAEKYIRYRAMVEERGWTYCYLTRQETYLPYRLKTKVIFGEENAFFLDTPGDWARFIEHIIM